MTDDMLFCAICGGDHDEHDHECTPRETCPTCNPVPDEDLPEAPDGDPPMMYAATPTPIDLDDYRPGSLIAHLDIAPAFDHDTEIKKLGIGAVVQVEPNGSFRVKNGDRNPRFGHGKTIEAAIYDLYHPGQLKPTME